ncbi:hypothetical protein EsDP_00001792 [Epichloe bromicola]|uniref:Copper homeostasis protein cutC homolog n=1 Tax=Epichloe bromicola TaxID=79588 RepID=A0ABQ0CIW7_9HYPO
MAVKIPLEVAVFSGESILKAQSQGASRVELNAPNSYHLGGTTPPVSELARVAAQVEIPVRIMIRPRGPPPGGEKAQDFIYTRAEVDAMADSIREFKATGLMDPCRSDGFVFGLLKASEEPEPEPEPEPADVAVAVAVAIDEENCATLIRLARPYGCVFHRAFDPIAATKRASEGIQTLISLGFEGVLTAGGLGDCLGNIDRIDHLCHRYAGPLEIVVGGGLRRDNILRPARVLAHYKDAVWMHTAALSKRRHRATEEIDSDELVDMVAQMDLVEAA